MLYESKQTKPETIFNQFRVTALAVKTPLGIQRSSKLFLPANLRELTLIKQN